MRPFVFLVFAILNASCSTSPLPLADYEGLYEYENDSTLVIVAGPSRELLYASISGARYLLRPAHGDVFLNAGGDEVEFVRNNRGDIHGYRVNKGEEGGNDPIYALLDSSHTLPPSIWVAKPKKAAFPYIYKAPPRLNDGIPIRALPANDPLRVQLNALTNAIYDDSYPYVQSALVFHDGALVYEEYFYDFHRQKRHQLRSATKTLMAILAGIAIDQKLIPSINELVLPYFDEYSDIQNIDEQKRAITLANLLTMQSGFDCNDWDGESPGNESKMVYTEDWGRFILDLPMSSAPGTAGAYCSGNVVLVGRIIEKASGKPLKDFADEFLFEPLGITNYQWDFRPDRTNIDNFTQAWLRPRDMMKIGILLDGHGVWGDSTIVYGEWVDQLTSPQSMIGNTPYGYLFWLRYIVPPAGGRLEVPQMSINGGQKVILLKEQNAIVVLTGGNYNQTSHTNELLVDYILMGLD